jgi:hypothetical protein
MDSIEFERRQRDVELYTKLYDIQQSSLNRESPVFEPLGNWIPITPLILETWQQWQSRGSQRGSEGNYGPAAEPCSAYSSIFAIYLSLGEKISSGDIMTRASPLLDPRESRRYRSMRRSSSLNDAADQMGYFSASPTAISVAKVKWLSLPSLLAEDRIVWAGSLDGKDAILQEPFKVKNQAVAHKSRKIPPKEQLGANMAAFGLACTNCK